MKIENVILLIVTCTVCYVVAIAVTSPMITGEKLTSDGRTILASLVGSLITIMTFAIKDLINKNK